MRFGAQSRGFLPGLEEDGLRPAPHAAQRQRATSMMLFRGPLSSIYIIDHARCPESVLLAKGGLEPANTVLRGAS